MMTYRWITIAIVILANDVFAARLSAKLSAGGRQTLVKPKSDAVGTETPILFEPELTAGKRRLRLKIAPWVRYDASAPSGTAENLTVQAREVSLSGRVTPQLRWAAGLLRSEWGATDLYNPLDVVNPRIYLDLLAIEKAASPALKYNFETENSSFELIYIPLQFASIMPGQRSIWLPREVLKEQNFRSAYGTTQVSVPDNLKYKYGPDVQVGKPFEHNFGLKYDYRFGSVDLTILGFSGAATAPKISVSEYRLTPISLAPPIQLRLDEVTLRRNDYARRTGGLGFSWVAEPFIFKAAAAHSDKVEPAAGLPGWATSAVASLEYTGAGPGESTITILLGHSRQWHQDEGDNLVTSLDQAFDSGVLYGFRWGWGEKASLLFGGLYDIKYQSSLARLNFEYKLMDGVLGSIYGDVLDGPPESPIGAYRNNDRVGLNLTWLM